MKRLTGVTCWLVIFFVWGIKTSFAVETITNRSIVRFPVENYSENIEQTFANYLGVYGGKNPKDYNGHHGGEDIAVIVGTDVYPIAKGKVIWIYDFRDLGEKYGYIIVIEHNGPYFIPAKSETVPGKNGRLTHYEYNRQENIPTIWSVYVHVKPISSLKKGSDVEPDKPIATIAKTTSLGAHLHFEIRLPNNKHDNSWALVGNRDNWSVFPGTTKDYTGYYKNLQKMVDAGLRHPSDFIAANSKTTEPELPADVREKVAGGVVYSDGKDAIYQDLKSGQKVNLTEDVDFSIKKVAINETGTLLVFLEKNRFVGRVMPNGKLFFFPSVFPYGSGEETDTPILMETVGHPPLLPTEDNVRDLSISLNEPWYLFYQYKQKIDKFIHISGDKYFLERVDFFGIWAFHVQAKDRYDAKRSGSPLSSPARWKIIDKKGEQIAGGGRSPFLFDKEGKQIARGVSILPKENAKVYYGYFPLLTIKDGNPLFACIYYFPDDKKWSSITIKKTSADKFSHYQTISVSLNSCRGLAWRPDGTISYESEGKIYSQNGKILINGIATTKFYWLADNILLYRTTEGKLTICFLEEKKEFEISDTIPEEFSYCFHNPIKQ